MPKQKVIAGDTLSNSVLVVQFGSKYHELYKEPLFYMPVFKILVRLSIKFYKNDVMTVKLLTKRMEITPNKPSAKYLEHGTEKEIMKKKKAF